MEFQWEYQCELCLRRSCKIQACEKVQGLNYKLTMVAPSKNNFKQMNVP